MFYKKRYLLTSLLLLLFAFIFIFSGCQQEEGSDPAEEVKGEIVVTDDAGNQLKFDQYPERIISLTPSNTEILFALDQGERVVGVTTYCDYPEETEQKARIGDLQGNIEEIVALEPDLVIAKAVLNDNIVGKLKEMEIPVLCVDPESIEGVYKSIEITAKVTGTESKGEQLISGMKEKIAAVQEKIAEIPETKRPKVFIEVGNDPLYTAGGDSFVDELVGLAGGINIASDLTGYQMYSLETVVQYNPDVILAADSYYVDVKAEVKKRAGWDTIKAVQDDNIIIGMDTNLVNRAGPRSATAVEMIAKAFYPDLF